MILIFLKNKHDVFDGELMEQQVELEQEEKVKTKVGGTSTSGRTVETKQVIQLQLKKNNNKWKNC